MVFSQGHVDEVLQSLSALIVFTDEIEDTVEAALNNSPNSGKVTLNCDIQLAACSRTIQGYDTTGTFSSLDIMWEVDASGLLQLIWEVGSAHIRLDKATPQDEHDSTPKIIALVLDQNFQVCLKYRQLHVSMGHGAFHDCTTVGHIWQNITSTLDVLAPCAMSIDVMQIYDAKDHSIATFQDLAHRRTDLNNQISYVASSATIMVGEYTLHLQGIEIVKTLELIANPLQPPDVALKVTIETVEITSLFSVRHISMSGILDVSGIHLLQVEANECQLLGGSEEIAVWQCFSYNVSHDKTKAPFAKVMAISCRVTMKGIVQSTSTIPFDTLQPFEGNHNTTIGSILQHYSTTIASMIQERLDRSKEVASNVCDGVAVALGCAAMNTTIATPIGLAVSLVAVGVKDGLTSVVSAGKVYRGETAEARYQFGDVTRGVVASFRQNKSNALSQDSHFEQDTSIEKLPKQSAKSRYGAIGGSSVGAVVGLTLIGGPVGLLAGSWIGGSTAKTVIRSKESTEDEQDESLRETNNNDFDHDVAIPGPDFGDNVEQDSSEVSKEADMGIDIQGEDTATCPTRVKGASLNEHNASGIGSPCMLTLAPVDQGTRPYRFGDYTRSILSRGKKARDKDDTSSYQFGDFTRGLFS